MASILIIDDDRVFCDVLTRAIARAGHTSTFCLTLATGLQEAYSRPYELVLLDVQLPDGNGLTAIEKLRAAPSSPEVIIITGWGNPDGAEASIRWGAWDYIEKPASTDEIILPVIRTLAYREERIAKNQTVALERREIIGNCPAMKDSINSLAQAAKSDVNVLMTGETGTGKELFARVLHKNSLRGKKPFVVVDCAALPDTIVESLLFGHEKGAFTGADRSHIGLIKQADGGTLFLDEVGELPLHLQKAFLRVLQEHRFRPVGSKTEETSDFRLIAATNRDLDQMVREGTFRSDLLFRVRAFSIELPPVRNRREDIKELALNYMANACGRGRIMMKGFSPDFFDILEIYEWPGNVRELFSTLQSALTSAYNEPVLYPMHLPLEIRAKAARFSLRKKETSSAVAESQPEVPSFKGPLPNYRDFRKQLLESGEKNYFKEILSRADRNTSEACRLSGLSRSRLYYFFQKHDLLNSGPENGA